MQFAFAHIHGNETRTTRYSQENQARIMEAFNSNRVEIEVYHLVQHGQYAGQVTKHLINFDSRTVTNKTNGAVHRLVMD
jgi:hypothetical protein